ncbi:isopenicillin epimerase [Bdellovibrio bacteriovorus]|uniref:Isopenicillin epimerase n=1 Tax=Bdellovibrio bacteriovorus TaxID=959 RepID=A0A150WJG6_BDEBC|nr:aminotransferase class V-fold PLP-dependent enzyme [Bdellovibrio bacteriovorus]KYG63908.1 isopenicillin epimerase [Bdellovibrio bacteriovorus]
MLRDYSGFFKTHKDTSFVNLNNGTLGLCPDSVIAQQKTELDIFEKNTTWSLTHAWPRVLKIQERLAEFLNGHPDDFFLRPNVTLAMNEIIMGMALPASSEILTTSLEYGAIVNILKYKAQRENLSLKVMPMDFAMQNPSDQDWVQAFEKSLTAKTKLVVISHVYTSNGLTAPIEELGRMLREKNILMVVDGAHAPGLMDLSFKDLPHVDFYGGNLHKWTMGPKGTAFGWVHPKWHSITSPLYGSWTTDEQTAKGYGYISPFTAKMLWSHSQSFSSYYGLEACFDFWNEHGKQVIFEEIKKRMSYLESGLAKKGLRPVVSIKNQAGFLAYPLAAFKSLKFEENIIVSPQGKLQVGLPKVPGVPLLRLTPHIHNTQSELDLAIAILNPV